MKKPELLAPAGSFERAKIAYLYGADAVYAGTTDLSLRTRVNIGNDEFVKIVELAKKMDRKIYAALNIYAFDKDLRFEDTIDFYKHFEKLQNYFEITGDLFSEANVTITDDVEYEDVTRVGEDTKQKVTFTINYRFC